MRRLPSLTALRTFECAARHAHVGRAAAELCVTDSAVSHQVRQLEEQLGTPLFIRRGRRIQPTPQARRLLHSLQQAFETVGEACEAIVHPDTQSVLRIAVTAELAQKWLVGRLADFLLSRQLGYSSVVLLGAAGFLAALGLYVLVYARLRRWPTRPEA